LRKVSSPHRYCRNLSRPFEMTLDGKVSSPHRYCRNRTGVLPPCRCERFQALIGTVETGLVDEAARKIAQVSSPHRYCRNSIRRCEGTPSQPRFKPS